MLSNPEFEMAAPQLAEQCRRAQARHAAGSTCRPKRSRRVWCCELRCAAAPSPLPRSCRGARRAGRPARDPPPRPARPAGQPAGGRDGRQGGGPRPAACWWRRAVRSMWRARAGGAGPGQAPTPPAGHGHGAWPPTAGCRCTCCAWPATEAGRGAAQQAVNAALLQAGSSLRQGLRCEHGGEVRIGRVHQELLAAAQQPAAPTSSCWRATARQPGPRLDRRRGAEGHRAGRMPGAGPRQLQLFHPS
jgi:hypothetical protein